VAKVDYLLIAEGTTIDGANNKLSVFSVFDTLNVSKTPAVPSRFSVAFAIIPDKNDLDDEGKVSFQLRFLDPAGKDIASVEGMGAATYDKERKAYRPLMSLADLSNRLPLVSEGSYKLELFVADKLIESKTYYVNLDKELAKDGA
jgi:hypothetical protein